MNSFILLVFLSLFIVVSLILETTVLNFPFIFFTGAILLFWLKKIPVYITVFVLGLVIDSLRVSNFGLTPFFLFAPIIIMLIYEKFSGSQDAVIAGFIIAITSFFYSQTLDYSIGLTITFLSTITILWVTYRIMKRKGVVA